MTPIKVLHPQTSAPKENGVLHSLCIAMIIRTHSHLLTTCIVALLSKTDSFLSFVLSKTKAGNLWKSLIISIYIFAFINIVAILYHKNVKCMNGGDKPKLASWFGVNSIGGWWQTKVVEPEHHQYCHQCSTMRTLSSRMSPCPQKNVLFLKFCSVLF